MKLKTKLQKIKSHAKDLANTQTDGKYGKYVRVKLSDTDIWAFAKTSTSHIPVGKELHVYKGETLLFMVQLRYDMPVGLVAGAFRLPEVITDSLTGLDDAIASREEALSVANVYLPRLILRYRRLRAVWKQVNDLFQFCRYFEGREENVKLNAENINERLCYLEAQQKNMLTTTLHHTLRWDKSRCIPIGNTGFEDYSKRMAYYVLQILGRY